MTNRLLKAYNISSIAYFPNERCVLLVSFRICKDTIENKDTVINFLCCLYHHLELVIMV